MIPRPLPAAFCARGAVSVARALLGRWIVSEVGGERCAVRIVETEAYVGPHDPASHAAGWHRSARNAAMYGPAGRAYVYFTYGRHWCFNVVTGRPGWPTAVLVRAGEPVEGVDVMRARRGVTRSTQVASGPGRLAQALGITGHLDGHDLRRAPLWLAAGRPVPRSRQHRTVRVGIRHAADRPLRFYEMGNPHVSRA